MLKLQKVQIFGFKSFSDRTEVIFPEGITAVVGPNGCGKSNIGDAINWVLGEQSPKMLRGSSMEDVIFNGSEARKPVGMAEVSLHLAGSNGTPERREVVLTRRLFRSGESEYLIDGARARLRDIQDLLREAHVGAKTYATIEQGRIDQILSAKPKDRRLIIEEAAGIAGFKHKRRLTELKLDATQANLLRVNDIIAEVRRQINSLKRQAARARRYRRLKHELREKETVRFGIRARLADEELGRHKEAESLARDAEALAAARLRALEADLAAERLGVEEAERVLREGREALHRLEVALGGEEALIRACKERIAEGEETARRLQSEGAALSARQAGLEEEIRAEDVTREAARQELEVKALRLSERQGAHDAASRSLAAVREGVEALRRGLFESMNRAAEDRNRRRALEEALERTARDRAHLEAERDTARSDLTRLETEASRVRDEAEALARDLERLEAAHGETEHALSAARARLAIEVEELTEARAQETSATARLATLEDVATRFAGVGDGVRTLLTSGSSAGLRTLGVVADYVEAGRDVEEAAEVYLQGLLPAVIVEDDVDARGAAALLRAEGTGRAYVLCRSQPVGEPAVGASSNGKSPFPRELLNDRRVLGRLRDRLKLAANGFLQERIGDAILADGLESALALHRQYPKADYVTPSGEVVYASGLVSAGGRRAPDQGLLAHNRRTEEARAEQAAARGRASMCHERVEGGREEVARLERTLDSERQVLENARHRRVGIDLRSQHATGETERTGRAAETLAQELAVLAQEQGRLLADLATARRDVEEAETKHRQVESHLQAELVALDRRETELKELAEEVAALRAEVAIGTQARIAVDRDRERRSRELADLSGRLEGSRLEADAARERVRESTELLAQTETELMRHLAECQEHSARVAGEERANEERRGALVEREAGLRGLRAELEAAREEARSSELGRARAEADRQHLDDLCVQELGTTATEAAASAVEAIEAMEAADPAALETSIAELKARIEQIGPVNMMAIEEFTELEERQRFLTAQQQDLDGAMASLRETIRRINSSSRERFLEAFEAIRICYQEIFKVLFGGGRADLALEEGEDVLERGVEILAQPPGKRLGSVQLLSGGEKAMAAIALLFAIFRYQPSPFCLLDEVDAALDDLNVNRFNRMLQEYAASTQFILITHNKLSMDSANLLYGVTMEEPGVSRVVSLKLE